MQYVADTHAIVWYLGGSPRLGAAARAVFDEAAAGGCVVRIPVIVMAEIVMMSEKRRAGLDKGSAARILHLLQGLPGFKFTPLQLDVVLRAGALDGLPDIHDRLIVAEAMIAGAGVITYDHLIAGCGQARVVW